MPIPFPYRIETHSDDERFMLEALKEGWKAFQAGEVPIGAVLVDGASIIARGHNQVELLRDATAHAEMLALTAASGAMDSWRLNECTLYCTVEPCTMCAGAMLLSRVGRLVWGAPDLRHGANGSWIDVFAEKHPTHSIEVCSGVLADESADMLRRFFQERRAQNATD